MLSRDTKESLKYIREWRPFIHVAIDHQPLTALEQWKASRHRLLWVVVVNHNVGKRDAPVYASSVSIRKPAICEHLRLSNL